MHRITRELPHAAHEIGEFEQGLDGEKGPPSCAALYETCHMLQMKFVNFGKSRAAEKVRQHVLYACEMPHAAHKIENWDKGPSEEEARLHALLPINLESLGKGCCELPCTAPHMCCCVLHLKFRIWARAGWRQRSAAMQLLTYQFRRAAPRLYMKLGTGLGIHFLFWTTSIGHLLCGGGGRCAVLHYTAYLDTRAGSRVSSMQQWARPPHLTLHLHMAGSLFVLPPEFNGKQSAVLPSAHSSRENVAAPGNLSFRHPS